MAVLFKRPSTKETKEKILSKYDELLLAYKEANSKLTLVSSDGEQQVKKSKKLSSKDIVDSLSELKITLDDTLNGIESSFLKKLKELDEANEQLREVKHELKINHDLVAEAGSVDALIDAQDKMADDFKEEMERTRKQWEREKEEYQYKFDQECLRDKIQRDRIRLEFDEKIKKESEELNNKINDTNELLNLKQNEINLLNEHIDKINAKHEKQITDLKDKITTDISNQYKYEYETKVQLLDSKNISLLEIIADLKQSNKSLMDELQEANQRASDIASKAVQSSKVIELRNKE